MAFAAADLSAEPRSFSVGPLKMQILTFSVASGDVSGTATADALSSISHVHIHGVALTSAPTYSGNVATLAFADPLATRVGSILVFGR